MPPLESETNVPLRLGRLLRPPARRMQRPRLPALDARLTIRSLSVLDRINARSTPPSSRSAISTIGATMLDQLGLPAMARADCKIYALYKPQAANGRKDFPQALL